jgi:hypothetical protein
VFPSLSPRFFAGGAVPPVQQRVKLGVVVAVFVSTTRFLFP